MTFYSTLMQGVTQWPYPTDHERTLAIANVASAVAKHADALTSMVDVDQSRGLFDIMCRHNQALELLAKGGCYHGEWKEVCKTCLTALLRGHPTHLLAKQQAMTLYEQNNSSPWTLGKQCSSFWGRYMVVAGPKNSCYIYDGHHKEWWHALSRYPWLVWLVMNGYSSGVLGSPYDYWCYTMTARMLMLATPVRCSAPQRVQRWLKWLTEPVLLFVENGTFYHLDHANPKARMRCNTILPQPDRTPECAPWAPPFKLWPKLTHRELLPLLGLCQDGLAGAVVFSTTTI